MLQLMRPCPFPFFLPRSMNDSVRVDDRIFRTNCSRQCDTSSGGMWRKLRKPQRRASDQYGCWISDADSSPDSSSPGNEVTNGQPEFGSTLNQYNPHSFNRCGTAG